MFKCIKFFLILFFITIITCSFADAKKTPKKVKNKPAITATPFEIDDEFKGEFKYYNPVEEKLKLKENKKAAKIEKKRQKLIKKKKKLELKQQKSIDNVKNYTDYKEKLENSFLPANRAED